MGSCKLISCTSSHTERRKQALGKEWQKHFVFDSVYQSWLILSPYKLSRWAIVTFTVWERRRGSPAGWWCPSSTLQSIGCLPATWSTRTRAVQTSGIQMRLALLLLLQLLPCCPCWIMCFSTSHDFVKPLEGVVPPCFYVSSIHSRTTVDSYQQCWHAPHTTQP